MTNIAALFAQAERFQEAGDLASAAQLCQEILAADYDHAGARRLLCVAHNQKGVELASHGRVEEGAANFRQAVNLQPDYAEAHYNLGIALASLGHQAEAIASYHQAVHLKPDYTQAQNNLGLLLQKHGKLEESVASFRQALEHRPDYVWGHINLGNVLQELGKLDEAAGHYRQALHVRPDSAEAYYNLGVVLAAQGRKEEAGANYRQALLFKPDFPEAHSGLGNALKEQGKLEEAAVSYRQALHFRPDYVEAHNNLGLALAAMGLHEEAAACYLQALSLRPDYADGHNNLGITRAAQGKTEEAVASYRQSLRLRPDNAETLNNLGVALRAQWKLEEAAASYLEALRLRPDYAAAHNNLGIVRAGQGQVEEAVACYRQAVQLQPDYLDAHTNLVFTLHFCPDQDTAAIAEECHRWNQQFTKPLARFILPHDNDRSPERRLRVGYVSPDLRWHPVGRFMLPLLEAHDHTEFEIFCYASQTEEDSVTVRCRAHADGWRMIRRSSDEEVAHLIRQDRIDILVDLAMHTVNNRLLVFARKPAPVQVTYLAYVGTTGLAAMDYRLTDPFLDPPGGPDERHYSEKSIRLPQTFWCYRPEAYSLPLSPLPALTAGHVTFGCLNSFWKVSSSALTAWCLLLKGLPGARLLLHAFAGSHRDQVRGLFDRQGVSPDRVTFVEPLPPDEYFRMYERMDVALDPFPYGGGTTTCDALWMGVPVITLAGRTGVGRGGVSILSNLGLPELVARDIDEYRHIALELAADLPRLSQLRATLRERMQASPLMDAPRLARNIEAAYRDMWRRWCAVPVSYRQNQNAG